MLGNVTPWCKIFRSSFIINLQSKPLKKQFSLTIYKYLYQFSLYQSGKSRADLWQFAGLVALERLIERSNRACDLDYHQRQQVRLLEGREKCEIKLTKPLKFMTGRKDCITDRKKTFKTSKKEVL